MKLTSYLCLFPLLLFCSCSPHSLAEFRKEGESRSTCFAKDLEQIATREQLLKAEPKLKKHFESLVDLMIETKEFQHSHPDDTPSDVLSCETRLEEQLKRIYQIEGGREIVERAQREALIRLDAHERLIAQKKKNDTNPRK